MNIIDKNKEDIIPPYKYKLGERIIVDGGEYKRAKGMIVGRYCAESLRYYLVTFFDERGDNLLGYVDTLLNIIDHIEYDEDYRSYNCHFFFEDLLKRKRVFEFL